MYKTFALIKHSTKQKSKPQEKLFATQLTKDSDLKCIKYPENSIRRQLLKGKARVEQTFHNKKT